MFIEPNTSIKILKNVPLNNSYTHTIYFADKGTQVNYFNGLVKHNLNDQTYQRVERGKSRVNIKAEALYDCNYMMFQNTSFGSKWFYAFITGVEYVNNVVSEITFEIDVIQTWLLDCEILGCLIEREHTTSDEIGEHLEAEPFDVKRYVTQKTDTIPQLFNAYGVVIQCSANVEGFSYTGAGMYNGIFSGVNQYYFPISNDGNIERISEFLDALVDVTEGTNSVVSMFMIPHFVGSTMRLEPSPIQQACSGFDRSWFNGFVPNNNKLYTSPYNVLYVHAGDDEGNTYQYEYLKYNESNNTYPFDLYTSAIANPQVFLVPQVYLGVADNFQNRVVMDGFPQCAFTTDSYRQYVANQGSAPAIKTVSSVMTAAAGATALVTGGSSLAVVGGVSAIIGGVTALANLFNEMSLEKNKPPVNKGSQSSAVLVGHRKKNFYFEQRTLSYDDAKKIDNFFSKFGYATNRLGIPNLRARKYWSYVKTVECNIKGGCPSTAIERICKAFNDGITFWSAGDVVGHYELASDNKPV